MWRFAQEYGLGDGGFIGNVALEVELSCGSEANWGKKACFGDQQLREDLDRCALSRFIRRPGFQTRHKTVHSFLEIDPRGEAARWRNPRPHGHLVVRRTPGRVRGPILLDHGLLLAS